MRIANRRFKPTLAGAIATAILVPVLISLGFWQLRRADQKTALLAEFQIGAATTQQLNGKVIEQIPLLQQGIAQGHFDSARQVLLDNIPYTGKPNAAAREGQPGYHVLTPFILADDHILLVNRGWVPLGASRSTLPPVEVNEQLRSIRGRINELPRPGVRLGKTPSTSSWPRVENFPTIDDLRVAYGDKLLSRVLLLDASESDGYARDWSARYSFGEFGPDRHFGYAIQWFAMASALCIIFIVVNFKRVET